MPNQFLYSQILLIILTSTFIFGCGSTTTTQEKSLETEKQKISEKQCPDRPEKLDRINVEQISLDDQEKIVSNQIKEGEVLGYIFQGKEGEKLMYNTDEEICIWVYSPDNNLLESLELPSDGSYTVQVATPIGAKKFELAMVLKEPDLSLNNSDQASSSLNSKTEESLNSQDIVEIIKEWQKAKRQIFAPPYDKQLASQFLTGNAYYQRISPLDNSESPVDWLYNNNAHYTYRSQTVEEVMNFQQIGDSAFINVVLKEERTLCVDGRPTKDNTATDELLIRYDFQYIDEKWKISDQETKDVINRRDNPNPSCRIIN